jgi:hypothetical protein
MITPEPFSEVERIEDLPTTILLSDALNPFCNRSAIQQMDFLFSFSVREYLKIHQ